MTQLKGAVGIRSDIGIGTINSGDRQDPIVRETPYTFHAFGNGELNQKLSPHFGLNLKLALWGGVSPQDETGFHQSTPIRGQADYLTVFHSRSPFSKKFGINEASVTIDYHQWLQAKLALFSQIEALAYPYVHNAGNAQKNAGLDSPSPTDIYGKFIGPMGALIVDLPFLPEPHHLQLLGQTGTAGLGIFDFSKLFWTGQLKYTLGSISDSDLAASSSSSATKADRDKIVKLFGHPVSFAGAVYYTAMDPAEDQTEFGEQVSDLTGGGVSLIFQAKDLFAVNGACSLNNQKFTKTGSLKDVTYTGCNLSATVTPKEYIVGAVGYSLMDVDSHQESFTTQDDTGTEHLLNVSIAFPFPLGPFKVAPYFGWQGVLVDSEKLVSYVQGDRPLFYGGATLSAETDLNL